MKNFIECSLPLIDPENDIIDKINDQSVSMKGSDLVYNNPGQFWYQDNTQGEPRLCTIRVDGQQMVIDFTNGTTSHTRVVVDDFPISWVIGPHPHHSPGAPRPK